MNYEIEMKCKVVIVRLLYNFTVFLSTELRKVVDKLIDEGNLYFVFDIKKVNFIDSFGIRCILNAGLISNKYGFKAVIINHSEITKIVINSLNIGNFIEFKENEDQAIKFFEE